MESVLYRLRFPNIANYGWKKKTLPISFSWVSAEDVNDIDAVLNFPHQFYQKLLVDPNIDMKLTEHVVWKVTNPGEQMTNTFHQKVYETPALWYSYTGIVYQLEDPTLEQARKKHAEMEEAEAQAKAAEKEAAKAEVRRIQEAQEAEVRRIQEAQEAEARRIQEAQEAAEKVARKAAKVLQREKDFITALNKQLRDMIRVVNFIGLNPSGTSEEGFSLAAIDQYRPSKTWGDWGNFLDENFFEDLRRIPTSTGEATDIGLRFQFEHDGKLVYEVGKSYPAEYMNSVFLGTILGFLNSGVTATDPNLVPKVSEAIRQAHLELDNNDDGHTAERFARVTTEAPGGRMVDAFNDLKFDSDHLKDLKLRKSMPREQYVASYMTRQQQKEDPQIQLTIERRESDPVGHYRVHFK